MSSDLFIEKAADFIAGHSSPADDSTIAAANEAFVDYFAVTLGGCQEPVSQNVFKWALERRFDSCCSLIGRSERLDAENAALCNGAAGHALDFDDTSWSTIGHPTTVVAPAAVAIAEKVGASGREVLQAYLMGVEVAHRLADVSMPFVSQSGWHTTGIYYTVGAAAAGSKILGIDRATTISALALAVSHASGVRANFGTQTKPYHAGMAARNGLEALTLAQAGVTASATAIEAADGFLQCLAQGHREKQHLISTLKFGQPYDLASRGLAYKRYPCCSGSHPACDAMLELVVEHDLKPAMIADIDVGASLLSERELVFHRPTTPQQARFSMQFALAAIIAKRCVTLDSFVPEMLSDLDVKSLMAKVHLRLDYDLVKLGFIGTAPVRMSVTLTDGRVLRTSRDLAVGNPERPFSTADHEAKFMMCARRVLSDATAAKVYQELQAFSTWENVADKMRMISSGAAA